MANLPDLNTGNIGIISYWCAHDHRATAGATVDPSDVIDILDSYTLYDNGVDGTYTRVTTINVRVKNDGWIIAWIDRTNEYALTIAKGDWHYNGYYDILDNWKGTGNISADTNTLIDVINGLYDDLSNSADFNFYKEDVGTFCYEFPDASVFAFISSRVDDATKSLYFSITSGTNLHYLVATGEGETLDTDWYSYVRYTYDDTLIGGATSPVGEDRIGTYDILGNNAYEEDTQLELYHSSNNATYYAHGCILAIWV